MNEQSKTAGATNAPEPTQNLILDAIEAQKNGAPPLNAAQTREILDRLEPSDRLYSYTNLGPQGHITLQLRDDTGERTLGELAFAPDGLAALTTPTRANVYVGPRIGIALEDAEYQKTKAQLVTGMMKNDPNVIKAISGLDGDATSHSSDDDIALQKLGLKDLDQLRSIKAEVTKLREQGASHTGIDDAAPQGNRVNAGPAAPSQQQR